VGGSSWEQSGQGVELTTHLHLVPRSKNAWSYTSTVPIRLHGGREDVVACSRRLHNDELHNSYSSPDIIKVIK
jgi:hypothetical protein